jgi:hypothetical protein
MTAMNDNHLPNLTGNAVTEDQPLLVKKEITLAAIWFFVLIAARLASYFIGRYSGIDESYLYLLTEPVAFATDVTMWIAAALIATRIIFKNTLARDAGTRFNQAFAALANPFHILCVYAIFMAPIFIGLAIIAQR